MARWFPLIPLLSLIIALASLPIAPSATSPTLAAPPGSPGEVIPGRYIVMVNKDVSPAKVFRSHGLAPSVVYSAAFNGFAGPISPGKLRGLADDPRVTLIEPDRVVRASDQTLPTGVDRVEADVREIASIDGIDEEIDVDIAVIDTGVDIDHPDLRVAGGVGYAGESTPWALFPPCGESGSWDDGHGHGTHVAGIIAARDNDFGVVGVAPGARIWGVKVLGDNGTGCLSDVAKGIDWVTCTHTKDSGCPQSALDANDIEVANLSLGWQGYGPLARTIIQRSVAQGVFYAVAAGNSGEDIYGPDDTFGTYDDYMPASLPEVATISAMADSDGQPGGLGAPTPYGEDDSFATFSNFSRTVVADNPVTSRGLAVDLLTPGVSILSTWKDGSYNTLSGTSMASPHAAALAALIIAADGPATDAAGVYAIRQALIDRGLDQASGGRLEQPDTEPDGEPEPLASYWEIRADNCPDDPNPGQEDGDSDLRGDLCDNCPSWPNSDQLLPTWPIPPDDPDCDGFSTTEESFMGTRPLAACSDTPAANDESAPDFWAFDYTDDQRASLGDVMLASQHFNALDPDPRYSSRYDLDASGGITLADMLSYISVFNLACTP